MGAWVNDVSGPFFWKGPLALRPPSQILSLGVYKMPTVSTISKPRLLVADCAYRLQTALVWGTGKCYPPAPPPLPAGPGAAWLTGLGFPESASQHWG